MVKKDAHVWHERFYCTTCKKTIDPELEAKRAMTEKDLADHHQLHHGQRWGKAPLLDLEHGRCIACMMHCLMRLTETVFQETVLNHITNPARKKALDDLLIAWGVYVTKVDYDGPKTTANQKAKKKTFIGEDCAKLYAKHSLLVDMAVISKNPKNSLYKDVWVKMEELADLFTTEARGKKRDLGIAIANLQKAWVRAFTNTNVPLYLHILQHATKWAEEIELWRATTQAVEHMNKILKAFKGNGKKTGAFCRRRRDGSRGIQKSSRQLQCLTTAACKQKADERPKRKLKKKANLMASARSTLPAD